MIPILLIVTATFTPAKPTVGDLITVRFAEAATVDASPGYEIVSRRGNTVVIRTFQPRPFPISGRVGNVAFRNMMVPVQSVLKPGDKMDPAPLKPPRKEPYPRMPFIAIGIAAFAAVAAWTAAALRKQQGAGVPMVAPAEQFRATVAKLRKSPNTPKRWAQLADAMRVYLAATTRISPDLTTTEALEALNGGPRPSAAAEGGGPTLIAEVLTQGDLEKFSPWGPRPADFDEVAKRALEVAA